VGLARPAVAQEVDRLRGVDPGTTLECCKRGRVDRRCRREVKLGHATITIESAFRTPHLPPTREVAAPLAEVLDGWEASYASLVEQCSDLIA
jgi:hypothetical protein